MDAPGLILISCGDDLGFVERAILELFVKLLGLNRKVMNELRTQNLYY